MKRPKGLLAVEHIDPACDHWLPMRGMVPAVPKDATWVLLRVRMPPPVDERPHWRRELERTERLVRAHWAHGGGEDQPPFGPGWFEDWGLNAKHGYKEVEGEATDWRPLTGEATDWRPLTGVCMRCDLVLPPYEKDGA